ncbi:MAG: gamma-glutamyltransferase family protein [Verrucomicrobia bacterium]|nr:gamma-glutamyltransferase family protein [Verrucomicrobiota bacterium]MDA1065095.1 gamma-glutamyltransferase family protein [Verrucomicrobiota bacterium]
MLQSPSWQNPTTPHPDLVYGNNVIATSEPHATDAAIDVFRKGGNAVDAALAAAITLTVTEPCSNGIGGDGFAIVAQGGKLFGLNACGKSPLSWKRDYFNQFDSMPERGWDSVTTPGAVSQWVALHDRFGKLPFKKLFQAAIYHARNGFSLGAQVANGFKAARETFTDYPDFVKTWLPEGFEPIQDAVFKNPAQADTLEEIAATKGASFYQGEIANKIVAHAQSTGGWLSTEDLATHQAVWVDPISTRYRSCDVHEIPPNGQGLVALIALGILDQFPLDKWDPDSADSIHVKIEAIKVGFAEASQHICDPDHWNNATYGVLEKSYLEERARNMDMNHAVIPEATTFHDHGTVYLSAADDSGTMVSLIQSNFMGFGSGIVIPKTGISMQNRGHGFSLASGHPNEVAPGKRPFHTIIPAMVTKSGNPLFSFGVMGGHMQPQGHVQVLTRILDNHWNPQSSSNAPRWFVTPDFELIFEPGFDSKTIDEMRHRGHRVVANHITGLFGGYQGIFKLDQGYCASSDKRKDGHAAAFD